MVSTSALYPYAPHFQAVDGHAMHYVDEGAGEPILMVHGNPTWSFYYRRLIAAFHTTHRVIAPDHIGCGRSDKPQQYPYRLVNHIDNLEALVLELDLRDITLVVHDWGGAIGLGVAGRHPERFKRIVLLNTGAFRSQHMPWLLKVARLPLLGEWLIRGMNAFAGLAVYLAVHNRRCMTPEVRQGYLAPYGSWESRVATLRFVQDIPTEPSHPSYKTLAEVENNLERLSHLPKLMIWGMRDWVFHAAFLDTFLRWYPDAEVHRVEDAGHYVLEEAHERAIPWIRAFLSRETPQRGVV